MATRITLFRIISRYKRVEVEALVGRRAITRNCTFSFPCKTIRIDAITRHIGRYHRASPDFSSLDSGVHPRGVVPIEVHPCSVPGKNCLTCLYHDEALTISPDNAFIGDDPSRWCSAAVVPHRSHFPAIPCSERLQWTSYSCFHQTMASKSEQLW